MSNASLNSHASRFAPEDTLINGKRNLIGLSLEETKEAMVALGLKPFRAKQLWSWIYRHGSTDFDEMTNLGKETRAALKENFVVWRPTIKAAPISKDGTHKWLMAMADGQEIETVYIPENDRGSVCVSSQIGCTNQCTFCHTGTMRLVRNLNAGEIIMQVMLAKDHMKDWYNDGDVRPTNEEPIKRAITNIVIMGMGEPFFNYDEVAKALKIIMDDNGIGIGRRKITLSTSGVVPLIERCGEELGVNLAISLHAVTDKLRSELIPLNKKYPIAELLEACRNYPAASNARRITFEYVMLKGVNDSLDDAKELVRLLKDIPAKINLLPYNPWPGSPYECSSRNAIQRFGDFVNAAGYASPVRNPRGRDIMAACGQLKSESQRERKTSHED